jgi:16S rRNA (cytosine1402-N4)-methyltransferase
MHTPVLLQSIIENLNIKPDGLYIDATFGEGGYTKEILQKGGKVLAIDWDESQVKSQRLKVKSDNLILINGNYADIEKIAKKNNFYPVDGIVFDLGLSMRQISESGRGFSFKNLDEPIDMRMSLSSTLRAEEILNLYSEDDLYHIFAKYSEDPNSKKIAQSIIQVRSKQAIKTVGDLVDCIDKANQKKDIHTYQRIFQALRVAVNDELNNLKYALRGALKIIKPTGRILVVTFHSIEDRLVKQFIKEKNLLLQKPIKGSRRLSYERSAKLRIISL